jgi:hypothetical protein
MSKRGLIPANIYSASADPTTPTPQSGDVYYNTTSSILRRYNGSTWADLGGSATYLATVSSTAPSSPVSGQVWLDTTAPGLSNTAFKAPVLVATTANITLSGTQTIDGVAVVAGDRVLVRSQTASQDNGIYVVSAGAWTRATDANTALLCAGAEVTVNSGTATGGFTYDTDFKSTDTLGTTAMTWNQVLDMASGDVNLYTPSTSNVTLSGTATANGAWGRLGKLIWFSTWFVPGTGNATATAASTVTLGLPANLPAVTSIPQFMFSGGNTATVISARCITSSSATTFLLYADNAGGNFTAGQNINNFRVNGIYVTSAV